MNVCVFNAIKQATEQISDYLTLRLLVMLVRDSLSALNAGTERATDGEMEEGGILK